VTDCHGAGRGELPLDARDPGVARSDRGPSRAGTVEITRRVLLLGNPNVGKSTLFNAVTGSHQRVVNAPGTTVELEVGLWATIEGTPEVVDLPGTYSLLARSPDEQVAADAVTREGGAAGSASGAADAGSDLVVVVVDATSVSRSLYLLAQAAHAGRPLVAALTMVDRAAEHGVVVEPAALEAAIGVPVVAIDPRTGVGVTALGRAVARSLDEPRHARGIGVRQPADGATDLTTELEQAEQLFQWVENATAHLTVPVATRRTRSDRIDRVLLNPWAGIPVFLAVMWALFELVTRVAAPLMTLVTGLVSGPASHGVRTALSGVRLGGGWIESLAVDGLLAGVGTVLAFVPLMAVMFVAIGVLESSGYLARAAFVADKAMRAIGLDGRAVLPLIVGFGCNVPALAATRTLPNARQRLLTGLLVPYTSCTARLTVYLLMASIFFPRDAGTVVFAMYLLSVLFVVGGGLLLRRTAFRDLRDEPLALVLPSYQRPRLRPLVRSAWGRVGGFVTKAGRVIVIALLVIWVLMAVPVRGGHEVAQVPVADSLYGATATAVAPVLAPAGLGDWHVASALMAGFVAKEVVVGSFAQSYAVTGASNPGTGASASNPGAGPGASLSVELQRTLDRTSGGKSGAAALALMVFVLAYTPCLATAAEQRRIFGRRWAMGSMGAQLVVAWIAAVLVFQIGRLW
jgi:ferrous iron transport protein B